MQIINIIRMFQSLNGEPSSSDQPSGVIIAGGIGSGKTAIIEQLVAHSCFSNGKIGLVQGKQYIVMFRCFS